MNRLAPAKQAQAIAALVEGNSIRATQNLALRNLPCKKIQCDEIWPFCYAKKKNVPADKQGQFGYGDVWAWTSPCADFVERQDLTTRVSRCAALMRDW